MRKGGVHNTLHLQHLPPPPQHNCFVHVTSIRVHAAWSRVLPSSEAEDWAPEGVEEDEDGDYDDADEGTWRLTPRVMYIKRVGGKGRWGRGSSIRNLQGEGGG